MNQIVLKRFLRFFCVCTADRDQKSVIGNKVCSVQFFYMIKVNQKTTMALMKVVRSIKTKFFKVFMNANGFMYGMNQAVAFYSFDGDNIIDLKQDSFGSGMYVNLFLHSV